MTWKELSAAIAAMPPEAQNEQANVFDTNTGLQLIVKELSEAKGWVEPPDEVYTLILSGS